MVMFVPNVEDSCLPWVTMVCGSFMGFSDDISGITLISDYLKIDYFLRCLL